MKNYRYLIFIRTNANWRFYDAFATEEATDKHAMRASCGKTRVKVTERFEEDDFPAVPRILQIFYWFNGEYHHKISRAVYRIDGNDIREISRLYPKN